MTTAKDILQLLLDKRIDMSTEVIIKPVFHTCDDCKWQKRGDIGWRCSKKAPLQQPCWEPKPPLIGEPVKFAPEGTEYIDSEPKGCADCGWFVVGCCGYSYCHNDVCLYSNHHRPLLRFKDYAERYWYIHSWMNTHKWLDDYSIDDLTVRSADAFITRMELNTNDGGR
jgi:hypothetical protein